MVCVGKNIANCSKNLQYLAIMCTLCRRCARCAHAPKGHVLFLFVNRGGGGQKFRGITVFCTPSLRGGKAPKKISHPYV